MGWRTLIKNISNTSTPYLSGLVSIRYKEENYTSNAAFRTCITLMDPNMTLAEVLILQMNTQNIATVGLGDIGIYR